MLVQMYGYGKILILNTLLRIQEVHPWAYCLSKRDCLLSTQHLGTGWAPFTRWRDFLQGCRRRRRETYPGDLTFEGGCAHGDILAGASSLDELQEDLQSYPLLVLQPAACSILAIFCLRGPGWALFRWRHRSWVDGSNRRARRRNSFWILVDKLQWLRLLLRDALRNDGGEQLAAVRVYVFNSVRPKLVGLLLLPNFLYLQCYRDR